MMAKTVPQVVQEEIHASGSIFFPSFFIVQFNIFRSILGSDMGVEQQLVVSMEPQT